MNSKIFQPGSDAGYEDTWDLLEEIVKNRSATDILNFLETVHPEVFDYYYDDLSERFLCSRYRPHD